LTTDATAYPSSPTPPDIRRHLIIDNLSRRIPPRHRVSFLVALILGFSVVTVLGYAYATGSLLSSPGIALPEATPGGDHQGPSTPSADQGFPLPETATPGNASDADRSDSGSTATPTGDPTQAPGAPAASTPAAPGDHTAGTPDEIEGGIAGRAKPLPGGPVKAHGLYLTSWVAGIPSRVDGLLDHICATGMNAMVIDVKDNTGTIAGPVENVKLAEEIGSLGNRVKDLPGLVKSLLDRGIYPIARIVVFQDPVLAKAKPEWAIRNKDGSVWRDADGNYWVNPYRREVWDYNLAIAKEAARMGFREIQFDYVRFPDNRKGARKNAVIDNPEGLSQADAIEAFLKYSMKELKPLDVFVSADVFAFTATAKGDLGIGQDFRRIAGVVDYICPMVYPSHYYNSGIYGFADPEAHPYEVAKNSLLDAIERSEGQRAIIRPWLQDFSLKHRYGPEEVAAQIKAALEVGIDEWLLWNPANVYTAGVDYGLEPGRDMGSGEGMETGRPKSGRPPSPGSSKTDTGFMKPNELGKVMILEYHDIAHDEEKRWSKPADMFRKDLERLYAEGYRAVSLEDFLDGSINLPRGYSPVVITFDDSTPGQLRFPDRSESEDGDGNMGNASEYPVGGTMPNGPKPDPHSAVGVMEAFAKEHPDFGLEATFYVLFPNPFGDPKTAQAKLKYLVDLGFDIGNHTFNHLDLKKATPEEIEKDLGMAAKAIEDATGGYKPTTLSLPYGSYPSDPAKAKRGKFEGTTYSNRAFLLVGAEPAVPPLRKGHDPYKLPRVQATSEELEKWLSYFKSHPEERYVSDGDPSVITVHPDLLDAFDRKDVPIQSLRVTPRT
ncbi:MAG TPA: polysaccharide deacetylase family protein, partial [Clostridia bacterium]|nr:polysaccharide deacetylase family protein [Clostridia bacterium]